MKGVKGMKGERSSLTPSSPSPLIGVNTWVWVSPLTDDALDELAPKVAAWGFDLIELPVENPGDWDGTHAAAVLAEQGLRAGVCAVMGPGRDLTSDDPATTRATRDYLRGCVEVAATVGAAVVGGPIYAPTGRVGLLAAADRRTAIERVADGLAPVLAEAKAAGVTLALEPLNRYETSLFNTVAQALELVELVGDPALGLLLDTFHLNVEERDLPAAIRAAGPHLTHFHACANDRGVPGTDHLDWPGIRDALVAIDYRGAVSIESFTAENRTIATAASIWRPLAPSQDAIATDGLRFLRGLFASA